MAKKLNRASILHMFGGGALHLLQSTLPIRLICDDPQVSLYFAEGEWIVRRFRGERYTILHQSDDPNAALMDFVKACEI